jgi:quercetin dioxygenase-like cupin family protein
VELLKLQETTILDQRIEYPKKKQARITSDIAVLEPGQETGWRRYKVPVYVYVLEGTLTVEYETAVTRDFAAGTAFIQATGTDFNGINKGEVPVRLLQVFMGVKGTKNIAVR